MLAIIAVSPMHINSQSTVVTIFQFYYGMSQMNVLFLMIALRAVWRSKQRSLTKLGNSDHTLKVAQKLGK